MRSWFLLEYLLLFYSGFLQIYFFIMPSIKEEKILDSE